MTITDYRSLIIRRIRMDKQGEMAKFCKSTCRARF